jgi:hypothetical protein
MAKNIVLTLSDDETQELERIDLDSDAPGALGFLREVIGKKIKALTLPHCIPVFEVTYSPRQKEAFQPTGLSGEML